MDFIDLRVGDAILLRCGGWSALVDGGTKARSLAVLAFLKAEGVHRLDYMISTHTHDDHLEGLRRLVNLGFPIGTYITHYSDSRRDPLHQRMLHDLALAGIPVRTVDPAEQLMLGGATLTFLWDDRAGVPRTANGGSFMTRVSFGRRSVLLAADVTGSFQGPLAETYPDLVRADVLKVPHHGYAIMPSRFLDLVSPGDAVITNTRATAGKVDRQLQTRGIDAYFLGGGGIHLETDGDTLTISQQRLVYSREEAQLRFWEPE
ncbi:MAG: ComEC/Rec2 family competence protein [Christensenellales bacterium]